MFSLGQVKPKVFGKSGLSFWTSYFLLSIKGREEGKFLPYNPPELAQPTEGHLCTGGVCNHTSQLRKPLGQMPRQSQR
jgi:hypothetical protein